MLIFIRWFVFFFNKMEENVPFMEPDGEIKTRQQPMKAYMLQILSHPE